MNAEETQDGAGDEGRLHELVEDMLGGPIHQVQALGVDAYNGHYCVEWAEGLLHMVRYFNTGDAALEGISFEHAVLLHLEDRGFARLPRLLKRGGETIFRRGEDSFAFSQWIDGCTTEVDRPISEGQVAGMARCMSEMHGAMDGFDRRLKFLPAHMFVFPALEVRDKADELAKRLRAVSGDSSNADFDDEARDLLQKWLPRVPPALKLFPWKLYEEVMAERSQYLVHGDMRLLNLVFADDEVETVLDFNASFNEVRLWDLCYTALSLAGTETLGAPTTPERASRFLATYNEDAPLSDAEKRLLPDFMIFTVIKLMLAAPCSWWVVQRAPLLEELEFGLSQEICEAAF